MTEDLQLPAAGSPIPDAEMAALRSIVEAGRVVFTCPRCGKVAWRVLIPKHARLGITCMHCGTMAVPDWKCRELLAERAAAVAEGEN